MFSSMDQLWQREADREISRPFTTPLLPFKVTHDKSQPASTKGRVARHIQQESQHLHLKQPQDIRSVAYLRTDSAQVVKPSHAPTIGKPRTATLPVHGGYRQTTNDNGERFSNRSNAAEVDSCLTAIAPHKEVASPNRGLQQTGVAADPQNVAFDQSDPSMQAKIALSAAAFEENLPFYLGLRKKVGIQFQEHAKTYDGQ
jgi:hypothetical protein